MFLRSYTSREGTIGVECGTGTVWKLGLVGRARGGTGASVFYAAALVADKWYGSLL